MIKIEKWFESRGIIRLCLLALSVTLLSSRLRADVIIATPVPEDPEDLPQSKPRPENPIPQTVTKPCASKVAKEGYEGSGMCSGNLVLGIPILKPAGLDGPDLKLIYNSNHAKDFPAERNNSGKKMFGDAWELSGKGLELMISAPTAGVMYLHSVGGMRHEYRQDDDVWRAVTSDLEYVIRDQGSKKFIDLGGSKRIIFSTVEGAPATEFYPTRIQQYGLFMDITYAFPTDAARPHIQQIVGSNGIKAAFNYTNGKVTSITGPYGDYVFEYDASERLTVVTRPRKESYPGASGTYRVGYMEGTNLVETYSSPKLPCKVSGLFFQYFQSPPGTIGKVHRIIFQNNAIRKVSGSVLRGSGSDGRPNILARRDDFTPSDYVKTYDLVLDVQYTPTTVTVVNQAKGTTFRETFGGLGHSMTQNGDVRVEITRINQPSSKAHRYASTVKVYDKSVLIEQTDFAYQLNGSFPPLLKAEFYQSGPRGLSDAVEYDYSGHLVTGERYFNPRPALPGSRIDPPALGGTPKSTSVYSHDALGNILTATTTNQFSSDSVEIVRNSSGAPLEITSTLDGATLGEAEFDETTGAMIAERDFGSGLQAEYETINANQRVRISNSSAALRLTRDPAERKFSVTDSVYEYGEIYSPIGRLLEVYIKDPISEKVEQIPDPELQRCPYSTSQLRGQVFR